MAIHGFDIAVGMSPEVCSRRVHIFTVAAQNVLSQNEINAILHDEEQEHSAGRGAILFNTTQ